VLGLLIKKVTGHGYAATELGIAQASYDTPTATAS
jgi:hypothetical protein